MASTVTDLTKAALVAAGNQAASHQAAKATSAAIAARRGAAPLLPADQGQAAQEGTPGAA